MTDDDALVLVNRTGDVGVITLNDPDRKNALSIAMKRELRDALSSLREDPVRCLVLRGAGDAFCAGGDLDRMEARLDRDDETSLEAMRKSLELTNAIVSSLAAYPAPVVIQIDGAAVGGGASIALAGDVRLASEWGKLGFVFRHVGLGPDGGSSYHLPQIVGVDVAKELAFTGRVLDASEAEDIGLVHHVFDSEEYEDRCEGIVSELANGPTESFRHAKQLMNRSSNKTLEQALEDELLAQATLVDTHDHREGVTAFLNDEDPNFTGR